jgi:hypothetical protein
MKTQSIKTSIFKMRHVRWAVQTAAGPNPKLSREAVRLRRQGFTYREIAARVHCTRQRVHQICAKHLDLADDLRHKRLFTVDVILVWADRHYERTGRWPFLKSGPVHESPGDTWQMIDSGLRCGLRGLPGGSSLSRLLASQRGVPQGLKRPGLNDRTILQWADAFHRRTGRWPYRLSGPIEGAPGETWINVDRALRYGTRGLPSGSSLHRLLKQHRGAKKRGRPKR